LRVISGTLKGRKLASFRGRHIRPTADRVREALFNILQLAWEERQAVDLFAGTGGLGIEALSRGASRVVFIEQHPRALEVLEKNVRALDLSGSCEILRMSVEEGMRVLQRRQQTFDVAFLDPPYGSGLAPSALRLLARSAIMRAGGVIVAEHHVREEILSSYGPLALSDRRRYGETVISFFTA
jgi:16S rRNA (guanine(966)-N(2))-methyltransferase RsmD